MLEGILAWLSALPATALYTTLAGFAALENIFPPLPADTIVAFGSFLAARGEASLFGAFLAIWIGNVGGALLTYVAGRRLGAEALQRRLSGFGDESAVRRVTESYRRHGLVALFITRFVPAVRAVVPPVAGALRIPALPACTAIAAASALWYGAIAVLAYRVGSNWEELTARIGQLGRWTGAIAILVVIAIVATVIWSRRR